MQIGSQRERSMTKVVVKSAVGDEPDELDYWATVPMVDRIAAVEVLLDAVRVPFIGRDDLIGNKRAVGRPQDVADVRRLTGDSSGDAGRF